MTSKAWSICVTVSRTRSADRRRCSRSIQRFRHVRDLHPKKSPSMPAQFWKASPPLRRSSSKTLLTPCGYDIRKLTGDSLAAMSNTLLNSASGHTATLGSLADIKELPGQTEIRRENLQRDVAVTARLEGLDLGSGIAAVQKSSCGSYIYRRRSAWSTAEPMKSSNSRSMTCCWCSILAVLLVFLVLLFEFRTLAAPVAILASASALDLGSVSRAAYYAHHF